MSVPPVGTDPVAVATRHTLAWLEVALPRGARRVLEVGCGRGALAAALAARGLGVTAIDRSADAVAAARAHGVEAVEADFLAYEAAAFEAIVFVRSFHHLEPLPAAIERARALLAPGGVVLFEEFAFEGADAATAAWYDDERTRLVARALIAPDDHAAEGGDALERWRAHFLAHGVHTGATMRAALAGAFRLQTEATPPCLYRWFADRLRADAEGAAEAADLFARETRGIEAGTLQAIGLRMAMRAA